MESRKELSPEEAEAHLARLDQHNGADAEVKKEEKKEEKKKGK